MAGIETFIQGNGTIDIPEVAVLRFIETHNNVHASEAAGDPMPLSRALFERFVYHGLIQYDAATAWCEWAIPWRDAYASLRALGRIMEDDFWARRSQEQQALVEQAAAIYGARRK